MKWIRPLLSLIGMIGITVGFLQGMIDPMAYFGLVTGIVVWWFKARDEEKKNGQ